VRVDAARPLLRSIGAWKPDATTASLNITELQSHIALGALLGYGLDDLEGMHRTWAYPHSLNESLSGTFSDDAGDPLS